MHFVVRLHRLEANPSNSPGLYHFPPPAHFHPIHRSFLTEVSFSGGYSA